MGPFEPSTGVTGFTLPFPPAMQELLPSGAPVLYLGERPVGAVLALVHALGWTFRTRIRACTGEGGRVGHETGGCFGVELAIDSVLRGRRRGVPLAGATCV